MTAYAVSASQSFSLNDGTSCLIEQNPAARAAKEKGVILIERTVSAMVGKEILMRIPEIPGFNEGEEVRKTAEYCEERGLPYEILLYHDFWKSKKKALDDAEDAHEKS